MRTIKRYVITATYLRRNFAKISRNLRGETYTVTSYGRVVGTLRHPSQPIEQWWERFEEQEQLS